MYLNKAENSAHSYILHAFLMTLINTVLETIYIKYLITVHLFNTNWKPFLSEGLTQMAMLNTVTKFCLIMLISHFTGDKVWSF